MVEQLQRQVELLQDENAGLHAHIDDIRTHRWHDTYNAALQGLLAYSGPGCDEADFDGYAKAATLHANAAHGPLTKD